MRCLICGKWSVRFICKGCLDLITPAPTIHTVDGSISVISFYNFDDVQDLIRSKYQPFGSHILKILAKKAFKPFVGSLDLIDTALIPIDDAPSNHFSHTALLARTAKSSNIPAHFNKLRATSKVQYAGKSLAFRKNNPRKFRLTPFAEQNVILVDDIMTTGTTIKEANGAIEKVGKKVLFAIVLSRAT